MRTFVKMPNLNNYTPAAIVDECAPLQEEYNRLDKLTKYYKTALKARLTPEDKIDPLTYQVLGEDYAATISHQSQVRVSGKLALDVLGELAKFIQRLESEGRLTAEHLNNQWVQDALTGNFNIFNEVEMDVVNFAKLEKAK